jgi:hypothetical protein
MSDRRRLRRYRRALTRVFGRSVVRADGVPELRIRTAEKRLGFPLPGAMRDYLGLAGLARENREHDRLYRPEDLLVEDGFLVFMEENQEVVHWGIPLSHLSRANPAVWQRVNSEEPEWFSEQMAFSEFIVKNLAWQRGVGARRRQ